MDTPGEQLINNLNDLRKKLSSLKDRLDSSGIERTVGLREAMGKDCQYYRKSMNLFIETDYLELRDLISQSHSLFNLIEGNSNE